MDNQLELTFRDTLEREGQNITIGNTTHKVFFRRNDNSKADTTPYNTLYALYGDSIEEGVEFTLNGSKWLILKAIQDENTVYKKYTCLKCNATIKIEYSADDLVIYDVYMSDISDSLNVNSNGITTTSKSEYILSLTNESKRLDNNRRFYCGAYIQPWKITDINYLNGLCYLYAERNTVSDSDDRINGIADRWNYEHKPDTYKVVITESDISIEKDNTQQLNVSVSKNGTVMETQPTIEYTIANGSICSVDSSNLVTAINVGTTTITGSYKALDNDICITDSVNVTVTEPPIVVGDIVVNPVYDESNGFGLIQEDTQKFTCSLSGVTNPQWNITLNANGNTAKYYNSTIDNANGTFTVENLAMSSNALIYTITETTTNKTTEYRVNLKGYF